MLHCPTRQNEGHREYIKMRQRQRRWERGREREWRGSEIIKRDRDREKARGVEMELVIRIERNESCCISFRCKLDKMDEKMRDCETVREKLRERRNL
jgi:hypothetical protein